MKKTKMNKTNNKISQILFIKKAKYNQFNLKKMKIIPKYQKFPNFLMNNYNKML